MPSDSVDSDARIPNPLPPCVWSTITSSHGTETGESNVQHPRDRAANCEAREAAAVAPALLTLPSSERLRARVKAIGNRREALGDRDFLPLETRSFDELRLATALTGEP
mmetsp:Transcript_19696/g.40806  ORF Transcript_19696/g.40806 Transcript_19696/m.40806 type:complete len:109 (-) Transcript_19696:883-1209(-)